MHKDDVPLYQGALSDQKHYDTLSLGAVTGMLIGGAFPFQAIQKGDANQEIALCFLGAMIVVLACFTLYWNLANAANAARVIAARIEKGDGFLDDDAGYSSAMVNGQGFRYHRDTRRLQRLEKPLSIRLTCVLLLVAIELLLATQAYDSVQLWLS